MKIWSLFFGELEQKSHTTRAQDGIICVVALFFFEQRSFCHQRRKEKRRFDAVFFVRDAYTTVDVSSREAEAERTFTDPYDDGEDD